MLTYFETSVLAKLLAGDHPALIALRQQLARAGVRSRSYSGAGFFLRLDVPSDVPAAPVKSGRVHFGDVAAQLSALKHGAGFVLFLQDGRLETLEGYSYDEPWREDPEAFELSYTSPDRSAVLRVLEAK